MTHDSPSPRYWFDIGIGCRYHFVTPETPISFPFFKPRVIILSLFSLYMATLLTFIVQSGAYFEINSRLVFWSGIMDSWSLKSFLVVFLHVFFWIVDSILDMLPMSFSKVCLDALMVYFWNHIYTSCWVGEELLETLITFVIFLWKVLHVLIYKSSAYAKWGFVGVFFA